MTTQNHLHGEALDSRIESLTDMAISLENPITNSDLPADTFKDGVQISEAISALRFLLAGNAYFTLKSLKTQTRYTYRVSIADCNECKKAMHSCTCAVKKPWLYFVALLTGSDNNSDYSYLGVIRGAGFALTKKSKMKIDSAPVVAFNYAYNNLKKAHIPALLEFWHEGRCGRCGRRLTVPESIAAGIGPECAGKLSSL